MNKERGEKHGKKDKREAEKDEQLEEGTEDELLVLRRSMFDTDADGGRQSH